MMNKTAFFVVTLALTLVAPIFAGQQKTLDAPAPEKLPEVLQVELLVFRHHFTEERGRALHEVQGLETPALPDAREMFMPGDVFDVELDEVHAVTDYKNFILHREAQRVRASKDMEIVYHAAWTQPLYPEGEVVEIRLLREQDSGLIDAVARATAGDYSQIDVHLYYDLDSGRFATAPDCGEPPVEGCVERTVEPTSRILYIKLSGSTPEGRLLYLDHPVLGILAQVKITKRVPPGTPTVPIAPPTPSTP